MIIIGGEVDAILIPTNCAKINTFAFSICCLLLCGEVLTGLSITQSTLFNIKDITRHLCVICLRIYSADTKDDVVELKAQ